LYQFGSPQLRSIGEVLHTFETAIGGPVPYVNLDAAPRDPDPMAPSNASIARLGWSPRIPFEQSIRDMLEDARMRLRRRLAGRKHLASEAKASQKEYPPLPFDDKLPPNGHPSPHLDDKEGAW
jgi:hypothetical protein